MMVEHAQNLGAQEAGPQEPELEDSLGWVARSDLKNPKQGLER